EHQLAEIVIAPILVEMPASETEAAPAIGALAGPGDTLRLAALDGIPNCRIAAMCAIGPAHGAGRWHGAEDPRHPALALAKADMKIPFIVNGEGLHSVGDRVVRKLFELRVPVRVDRPIDLEGAADPIQEFLFSFLDG